MKKLLVLILSMSMFLSACGGNTEKISKTDIDSNSKVEKNNETDAETSASKDNEMEIGEVVAIPKDAKVIAGTVMASEILNLLDVDVVGVPTTKKVLPEKYKGITEIGMSMKPDVEKIVSLGANVLITDATLKESLEPQLQGKGIEVIYMNNNSYEDLKKTIATLGKTFGKEDKAGKYIAEMKKKEEEIKEKIKDKENPKVMVLFGTTESFMLATKGSFVGGMVEKLGATNVTDELDPKSPAPYVPFSLEQSSKLDPDIILRLTHMEVEASKAAFEKEFSKGLWQNMRAVKEDKVIDLDPEYFGVTANIKASESIEKLADLLYK